MATFTSVQVNNGGSATGGTSTSVTLGAGITQGNLVVLYISAGFGTTITPPSGWTAAPGNPYGAGGLTHMSLFYQVVSGATAGQTSWSFSWSGSHTPSWVIREWNSSTGWQASPLDKTQTANSSSSTTVSTGTTATTAQASELWTAGLCYDSNAQTESGLTAGWTQGAESAITGSEAVREAFQSANSIGTASCQLTYGVATDNVGVVATFMPNPLIPGPFLRTQAVKRAAFY